jgi:hypothetical protein
MRAPPGARGGLVRSSFGLDLRSGDGTGRAGKTNAARARPSGGDGEQVRVGDSRGYPSIWVFGRYKFSDWWDQTGRPRHLSDVEDRM